MSIRLSGKFRKKIYKFLRYSGLPFFFKNILQKKKVTILLYHDPDPKVVGRQFQYLLKEYNVISLDDFLKAKSSNDLSSLPNKSLIITFDDGHKRNFHILPILKKLKIPVTIFLCSSIIGTNRHFWFKLNPDINEKLKDMKNSQRLNFLSEQGFQQQQEYGERHSLSISEISQMSKFVDFQSHTCFHPCLTQCSDELAEKEIFESRKSLEKLLDKPIYSISYPNGDYKNREIQLSKKSNYKCGITVDFGFNDLKTDIFRLKRLSVNDTSDMDEFIVKSSGLGAYISKFFGKKEYS